MDKRGKTLIAVGVFLILVVLIIVPFVFSVSENVKVYDEETKIVIIRDRSNNNIVEVKLNTPLNNKVGFGYQKVAELNSTSFKDYAELYGVVKTYDKKDGMKEITRQIDFKYLSYEDIQVNDYEEVCSLSENGTNECSHKVIRSYTIKREVWLDFDKNKVSKKEEVITIGLFTDVQKGDYVEWIPTIAGLEVEEWASWTADLNVDLYIYFRFEETSGWVIDEVSGLHTNTTAVRGVTGKIDNGFSYEGGDATGHSTFYPYTSSINAGSINFWMNTTDTSAALWVQDGPGAVNNVDGSLMIGYGNWDTCLSTEFCYETQGVNSAKTTHSQITDGDWHMITLTIDGTTHRLYIDGTSVSNFTSGINIFGGQNGLFGFFMGMADFIGFMDEWGIWNRSLNIEEISFLYNDGDGCEFGDDTCGADTIPPHTTKPILNSTDGTNRSNQNLNCYATLTDEEQENITANYIWYKNGAGDFSGNVTVSNNTNSLITTLGSGNITKGENWICEITPYDGFNYGNASNSSAVAILNSAPTHDNPLLITSTRNNLSTEDLICYNQSTIDADNDVVVNIYNWYKDNQPLAVLNLVFEINVDDYSGNKNHGTRYGASFVNSKDGLGNALEFDGVDDYVEVTNNFGTSFNSFSVEAWVNLKDIETQHRYILERDDTHFYISIMPERKVRFRHIDLTNGATETESNAIEFNEWAHIAVVYDGAKTYIYVNGELKKEQEDTGNISFSPSQHLYIGSSKYAPSYPDRTWNGSIDEVKIYSYALTPQQIINNYNLNYNTIVSEETSGGDVYMCQITPNDDEEDGETLNSSELDVLWAIEFDVRDSYSNVSINNVIISCNYSGFNQAGDTTNPYGVYGFPDGSWECEFKEDFHFDKTIIFNANSDKMVPVLMSESGQLSIEEHTWLEAIYNCIILEDCSLYNLLLEINQTIGNIWEHTKPTDSSVVISETITNKVVNSTNNLTIDYSVYIPIKAGYSLGAYLPVRIGFWFMDETNTTCYNQGDKPTGVNEPYCQPLIIETIGPMGGNVNFTIELQPSLSEGDYSIKRIIDIDPSGVWYNYGSEVISDFTMLESLSTYGASVENTGEVMPERNLIKSIKSGITGAVTDVGNYLLLSGWQIVVIIGIIGGVLVFFIISRTIIRLKTN